MPPEVDQDLAQLYAAMIAQQTPPTYDDGVSLLQRNPAMMDVGLFGKPKPKPVVPPVDIQRRKLFGLSEMPTAPAPMPMQPPAMSPVYKALTTPMSRRDFLGHTARAAGNMALRGALPELGALAETQAPLTEAAKDVGKTIAKPVTDTLREVLMEHANYAGTEHYDGLVFGLQDVYGKLKGYVPRNLKSAIPDWQARNAEISKLIRQYDKDPSDFDAEVQAQEALESMIKDIANQIPEKDVWHAITDIDQDFGNYEQSSDVIDMLHGSGHTPEQIHDFMDTHHPDYDPAQTDQVIQDLQGQGD